MGWMGWKGDGKVVDGGWSGWKCVKVVDWKGVGGGWKDIRKLCAGG